VIQHALSESEKKELLPKVTAVLEKLDRHIICVVLAGYMLEWNQWNINEILKEMRMLNGTVSNN